MYFSLPYSAGSSGGSRSFIEEKIRQHRNDRYFSGSFENDTSIANALL
jgi:hypothetical protein